MSSITQQAAHFPRRSFSTSSSSTHRVPVSDSIALTSFPLVEYDLNRRCTLLSSSSSSLFRFPCSVCLCTFQQLSHLSIFNSSRFTSFPSMYLLIGRRLQPSVIRYSLRAR